MVRKSKGKPLKKAIYIFTEGHTEKNYFRMLNRKYNATVTVKVQVIPEAVGKQGMALLKHALGKIKTLSKEEKRNLGGVYLIFDKDSLTYADIEQVLLETKREDFSVGFSNRSFEVWLLAHFEKPTISLAQEKLYQKLEGYFSCSNYEKKHKDDYDLLQEHLVDRISQALSYCSHFPTLNQTIIRQEPYTNLGQVIQTIYQQSDY